ncbi:MAG: hypothetical protein ABH833_02410 [Parcubacteria group bacterium]
MNQKGFKNIILVVAIILLVGVVGYFVFVKKSEPIAQQPTLIPTQAANTFESNPTSQLSNQPTSSAYTNYKKMVSESFDYGDGEQQFGIMRVAGGSGPSSFSTDKRNYLYITDFQNSRVKVFDSSGKQLSIINTAQSLVDIVVDDDDNVYGYAQGSRYSLYKYDGSGSLLGKIENPSAFSEISSSKNTYGELYIFDNKLYITDSQQNSYLISLTEGNLKSESVTKIDGIYGLSGKRYKTNYTGGGTVDIISQAGITEKTIVVGINGLRSLVFLSEDQNGNFYIQAEISDGAGVKLQVRRYNSSGNLSTTFDIPNSDYSIWVVKLLHVDRTGDIWQVVPGENKLFVNRWSTIY